MITGNLKNKINAIWQNFHNKNMAQTSDIVNKLKMVTVWWQYDDNIY